MKKVWFCLLTVLLLRAAPGWSAEVQTLDIPSAAMKKSYRANVVLPDNYAKNEAKFPVLYLLHGAFGHFDDWLNKTPDKMLVQKLADAHNLIIVMPEGETFSFYLDSPIKPDSQFETYITQDVIGKVDETFRTVRDKKGRVITGLSMGGHGALYLATRHPNLFCAAGSMSGAVDITKLGFKEQFEQILGDRNATPDLYAANAVINMVDKMKTNALPLIFDCGVDDFLIEINRDLHRRLVEAKVPHDYSERPGAHTWEYWENSLPYHVLFFDKILQANGTLPVKAVQ